MSAESVSRQDEELRDLFRHAEKPTLGQGWQESFRSAISAQGHRSDVGSPPSTANGSTDRRTTWPEVTARMPEVKARMPRKRMGFLVSAALVGVVVIGLVFRYNDRDQSVIANETSSPSVTSLAPQETSLQPGVAPVPRATIFGVDGPETVICGEAAEYEVTVMDDPSGSHVVEWIAPRLEDLGSQGSQTGEVRTREYRFDVLPGIYSIAAGITDQMVRIDVEVIAGPGCQAADAGLAD